MRDELKQEFKSDKATRGKIFEYLSQNAHALSGSGQLGKAKPERFLERAQGFLEKGKFAEAIMQLNLAKDEAQGIRSQYLTPAEADELVRSKALNPGLEEAKAAEASDPDLLTMPVYFRDARNQPQNPGNACWQSWAIMGLGYFNTALKLLETSDEFEELNDQQQKNLKLELTKKASLFLQGIRHKTTEKEAKAYLATVSAKAVVPFLAENLDITEKEARKRINKSKDFVNFDQEPHVVATLTEHPIPGQDKKKTVLDVDVPIFELTDDLRKQYHHLEQQPWFKKQKPYIQSLIKYYRADILRGRVIPTQLIAHLPGLRNAYESRLFGIPESGKDEWFRNQRCAFERRMSFINDPKIKTDEWVRKQWEGFETAILDTWKEIHVAEPSDPIEFYRGYRSGNLGHKIFSDSTQNKLRRYVLPVLMYLGMVAPVAAVLVIFLAAVFPPAAIVLGILVALIGLPLTLMGSKKLSLSLDKRDLELTKLSVAQMEEAVNGKGNEARKTELLTFSLVSNPGIQLDSDVEQQMTSLGRKGHSNTPLNIAKIALSNNMSGFNELLKVADAVDIHPALKNAKTESLIKEGDKTRLKKAADELRLLMNSKFSSSKNLQMVSKAQEVVSLLNECMGYERIAAVVFCKSGKDRAGAVTVDTKTKEIYRYVTGKSFIFTSATTQNEIDKFHRVVRTFINANQGGKLSGMTGGSNGCDNVKTETELPAYMQADGLASLQGETANQNKGMPSKKKVNSQHVTEWNNALSALGASPVVEMPPVPIHADQREMVEESKEVEHLQAADLLSGNKSAASPVVPHPPVVAVPAAEHQGFGSYKNWNGLFEVNKGGAKTRHETKRQAHKESLKGAHMWSYEGVGIPGQEAPHMVVPPSVISPCA